MTHFTESVIEQTALDWLKDLGYAVVYGGDNFKQVIIK